MKISCVSYLNAAPFVYGLQAAECSKFVELLLLPPAECAAAFFAGMCDVALIPVGTLLQNADYQIITDYCIGAVGSVYSVCLFANEPVGKLKKVYVDCDSRTSVKLFQILVKEYWRTNLNFVPLPANSLDIVRNSAENGAGYLLIGDKTFECRSHFSHIYDLAEAWQDYAGLPFVFAVWVAKNSTTTADCMLLNSALAAGISSITKVIAEQQPHYPNVDVELYLTKNIDYQFDSKKKEGMSKFLTLINS